VEKISAVYGYSRQNYYERQHVREVQRREETEIIQAVQKIRQRQPRVGTRKIHRMITIAVGRDRLYGILRDAGLLVNRKKRYQKTTNSRHRFKKYGNLIKDKLPGGPGEQHVSDITYINTWEGYCYLSLITDRYSRKIVGHELSRSLCIEGSIRALEKAIAGVEHPERLIHHSDRGLQYCSNEYVKLLNSKGIQISMTEENHVYENALAERVNGILKDELLLGEILPSYEVAKQMVEEAVTIYNEERLHMSIGYVTPHQKHLNLN
jgi:putative transposase